MKKKYIKAKLRVRRLKSVLLRKPSTDSYNGLSELLIATYPGCGHSCTSDKRLKKNIKKLDSSLIKVNKMLPVSFDWKKGESKKRNIGLIAQDVEGIYPEVVYEGEDGFKRIEYDKITAILISAIQELTQRLERLEKDRK